MLNLAISRSFLLAPGRDLLRLFRLMEGHYLLFAVSVGLGILQWTAGIFIAGLGAWMVGLVATGAGVDSLSQPFRVLMVWVLVTAVLAWLEMWLSHDLAYRVLATIRASAYDALARIAPGGLGNRRTGDVVSATMADVETLEWFYAHTLGAFFACTIVPLGVLVALALFHPLLPILLCPLVILAAAVPLWFARRSYRQGKSVRKALGQLNAKVVDIVQGLKEVALFGAEKQMEQALERHNRNLVQSQIRFGLRASFENGLGGSITATGMLIVLATAAYWVSKGELPAEHFTTVVILSGAVFGPVAALGAMVAQLGAIVAAARRVLDLVGAPAVVSGQKERPENTPQVAHFQFHNATFRYEPGRDPAVRDLNFEIRPGESVALVGHSGAGKSTCVHLLMRFFDPESGEITLGGFDLRTIPRQTLRELIAWVPQDIYLFDRSVAENIALGRPEASDAEIGDAAKQALADEFIQNLPQGYRTRLGERGARLSGGQRQRIALARAFLKNAPITIMDEAVSNLDSESERALTEAIARLKKDRTTLIIAHRLSTIQSADRVVVLENGELVETGEPAALLAAGGPFARLMERQFGYEWAKKEG